MDVDFATLGNEEWCCGDHILRLGERGLFEILAEHNASLFKKYDFDTYIEPYGAFGVHKTTEMIATCMFGGAGTVVGPVIGSVILFSIGDFLWTRLPYLHMMIFSVIIVAVVLFMPQGMIGWLRERYPYLRNILK